MSTNRQIKVPYNSFDKNAITADQTKQNPAMNDVH
jgi:hypothetical protein